MPVNASDLPKHLRDQVERQAAADPRTSAQDRKVPTGRDRGPAYRCHSCGEEFPWWGKAAEDHGSQPGHGRLDAALVRADEQRGLR